MLRDNVIIPVDLGRKALALVERTHEGVSSRGLVNKLSTKRNMVAAAMLPQALTALRAATSTFKIRVFLWVLAAVVIAACWLLKWWLAVPFVVVLVSERILAAKERHFWILLAAVLLSAEILAADFAGWGAAYPLERQAAIAALALDAGAPMEWLDYYLPRRAELRPDVLGAFGPSE